ncbi:MAG: ParB N-terminal domain-containing protein [Chroococcidiopsidaceae cyanobacterium CP_BM_RX_35]|nr:ParB N-terminal domain-containing protein [Chroococcidiopsidaceae cyanobacterium CP_BM_RX_35]
MKDKNPSMPVVAIAKVKVGTNRRPLQQEKVDKLMESIKANGLLNPITVDQNFNLIAGLHRLTACQLLGFDQIECKIVTYTDTDRVRLAEIDENLIRSELSALERGELSLERDKIMKRLKLRAQPGDNQYSRKGSEMISPPVKTTMELAKEVGYTERTFQQGKQIAKSIDPEVKEIIKDTSLAKSPTALLAVARAGSEEREQAEQAEKAAREAELRQELAETERQSRIAVAARARQRELQLLAVQHVSAQRTAKREVKQIQRQTQPETAIANAGILRTKPGDCWLLERHMVYYGDTASSEFINYLPSNAALAVTTSLPQWHHDYLVDEARVVAVLNTEGHIHQFCTNHQMPFRFELLIGKLYVAIFSRQSIPEPQRPIQIEGVEGIVAYLVSLYTQQGNFVIVPFLGYGEALIVCERMGRICFAGDSQEELVSKSINRWQQLTGKRAVKTTET